MVSSNVKFRCPHCNLKVNYTGPNIEKYKTDNGRLKCKNCGQILSEQDTEDILTERSGRLLVRGPE